jgi:ATP synthase protein I
MSGFGAAFRIGVELVAALIVGVGAGLLLDRWLGTAPWFLIVFFFLGAAAGVLNVYRAAAGMGMTAETDVPGETREPPEQEERDNGPA